MFKIMALAETYMLAGIATGELMGTNNPLQAILGDLNPNAPAGSLLGPQGPGVLTLKEIVTGSADAVGGEGMPTYGGMYSAASGTVSGANPLQMIGNNFANNWFNIVWRTTLTTAGFRIANKVLSRPKSKINAMLRQSGLGSTVQI
jgi:hypothetical protein